MNLFSSEFVVKLIGYFASLVILYTETDKSSKPVRTKPEKTYDFIVVGSGSGGAVVASRLSEDPNVRILLLEAGGHENILTEMPFTSNFLRLTPLDWKYVTEPQENACLGYTNKQCIISSGKVLGGTSAINYMLFSRGNRRDYDRWAALGNTGWSWNDVLPYFLKMEDNTVAWTAWDDDHHHTGGYQTVSAVPYQSKLQIAILRAASENGHRTRDINGELQTGFMPVSATMRNGSRCSAAKSYLTPAMDRPNLHIMLNAFVTKILVDKNKRAYGVEFETNGQRHRIKASKEVILSAGAIRSPQLLMLSGIGPRKELQKLQISVVADLPGVGENMHDHVMFYGTIWTLDQEDMSIEITKLLRIRNLLEWIVFKTGPFSTLTTEVMGFLKTPLANSSDDWPDIQMLCASSSIAADPFMIMHKVIGPSTEAWEQYIKPSQGKPTFSLLPIVLRPKSRGFIKLRSRNPYDSPRINPQYLSHEEDVNNLVEGIKLALALGSAPALLQYGAKLIPTVFPGCDNDTLYSEAYWICVARHYSNGIHHPCGSAKMGPRSDPMAVVDPELKVHKISGLRVADASIMPEIISGNTNVPTIMIGEKAADMIKRQWNLQRS